MKGEEEMELVVAYLLCSSTKSRKFKISVARLPDPSVSFLLGNKNVLQLLPHHFSACPQKNGLKASFPRQEINLG